MKTIVALLVLPWSVSLARAQDVPRPPAQVADVRPSPTLRVADTGERVGLARVAIETRIVGVLAETRMTLTFANSTARVLAGDLSVPLPPDATVSGYALDVAGRMVDGVVVAKGEARRVYEIETRKRVDPGLVEWTRGNVFTTRVFPIPPNGTRTVRLSWVASLDSDGDDARLRMPLAFVDRLDELSVRIEVVHPRGAPTITGNGPVRLAFDDRHVAEGKVANQAVTQDVTIVVPNAGRHALEVERASDGATYFHVRDWVRPADDLVAPEPKRVRIVWDASLSRASSDRAAELAFLGRYLATVPGASLELVVLRNVAAKPRKLADPEALVAAVAALDYDGGTQLGAIPTARADLVLVFSDGLSTFGVSEAPDLGAPTWVISSSAVAAHDALRRLAVRNGGMYVDLRRGDDVGVIGRPVWSLLEVAVEDGAVRDVLPADVEPVSGASVISGVLEGAKATLRVSWGVPGRADPVVKRYVIERPEAVARGETLRFAWAELKLAALMADPTANAERIADLGRAHGIVTPGTSLLVLETLEQYLSHRVRPPASWPEMRRYWDAAIEERAVLARASDIEHLDRVAEMWAAEVAWYQQTFTRKPRVRTDAPAPREAPITDARCLLAMQRLKEMTRGGIVESLDGGTPDSAPPKKVRGVEAPPDDRGPTIVMTPWHPRTPWTKALAAAQPNLRVPVYRELRARFGDAPSFYLDSADFFLGVKDRAMALQVLSNVAELRLDDPALLRVLAHRLAQLGELGTAQTIFEEVRRLRPEEPQSHRDLALVMGERARTIRTKRAWQAALDELAMVVKRKWDRFDGITIIALHELNAMWTRAQATGAVWPLELRFQHAMPLDVRIAMTWDVDGSDMDLHVIEPTGEEAFFGHPLTESGGRVTRDFTEGYGPEVYGLRRGTPGVYQVKAKFFGASAQQMVGAVTLQVDVFTDWGRPNEKKRSMTLRLTEPKQDFVVGRVSL